MNDLNNKKLIGKFRDYDDNDQNNINNWNIISNNKEIQEAFYKFVHNICLYFYENLSMVAPEEMGEKLKKKYIKNDKESNINVYFNENNLKENGYIEEEVIFLEELIDTMKFQSFVFGFLQSYNPIDLYKIPLTFTEEFLSIISRKQEKVENYISFLKLIDSLYFTGKRTDEIFINFHLINFNYFKLYKSIFDREIYDISRTKYINDKKQLIKFISGKANKLMDENNNDQRILLYQSYELDDQILLKYIHMLKNIKKEEYYGNFGAFYIEENLLKTINTNEIETYIENYCINSNILSLSDICCANIILLFTLSLKSLKETIDFHAFLGSLLYDFTVFRKYYSILLRMIYILYIDSINRKYYKKAVNLYLCSYPCINSIRQKKLVPNEDLLKMINIFNKYVIGDKKFPNDEQEEEKIFDKNIKDIKLYGEQLKENEITDENLYVFHNFTYEKFLSEKECLDYINQNINDNPMFLPKIRFYDGNYKLESLFYSQKTLLDNLMNELNKYIEDLDDNKLQSKIILDSCLNIFIFMRNSEEFESKDDIFETVKSIFYIFMNQLFILKSIKESTSIQ